MIADPEARREALRTLEPLERVILEEPPAGEYAGGADGTPGAVEGVHYTPNEVLVTVAAEAPALLVLGDAYMDGWLAYLRPAGSADPEDEERALHIYRANGNFRAVEVPAGRWEVRFKYSPNPVKLGLYATFMAGVVLALALAAWAWWRFRRAAPEGVAEGDEGQRVAVNTVAPIALSLVNKAIDMVFAMLMLRILGPADAGEYYFAVVFIGWFDILTAFGLNTLVTRALARDRSQANRYLANATGLRLGLWLAMGPILALFFLGRAALGYPIDPRTILAIALFGLGLLPSNVSAGLSAVFIGYERMEIPAMVSTLTTVLRVILGTLVLLLGLSYPGLGAVSIAVNLLTVGVLYGLVRRMLFRPRLEVDWAFQREMLRESYPLMVNNLLATLFFKVAVFLLEWMTPDNRVVGWYGTALKYIDAVGVIPAYFTMAIFPLMSRYAADSKESLLRAYRLAIKILVMVALPLATVGWALADVLVAILGAPVPAGIGRPPAGHDLVHAHRVYQLGDAVRSHRAGPPALPDAGLWRGACLFFPGQPGVHRSVGLSGVGLCHRGRRAGPSHALLRRRAPLPRADPLGRAPVADRGQRHPARGPAGAPPGPVPPGGSAGRAGRLRARALAPGRVRRGGARRPRPGPPHPPRRRPSGPAAGLEEGQD